MTPARRWSVAAAVVVAVVVAVLWGLERRTRPEAVGPRFTEALLARHPGTTVDAWQDGVMRVALSSGVYIDLRLHTLFDACRADRFGCTSALAAALDDVDRVERATRAPTRAMIRPTIVAGTPPGFTLGYVTEPVVGRYELRYRLVEGLASTFVTSAIADRLAMSRTDLKTEALAMRPAGPPATLQAGPGDGIYTVHASDDPAAVLLDGERMKAFAATIGSRRLYAALTAAASLSLAKRDEAGARALTRSVPEGGVDLLGYDTEAPVATAITSASPVR